MFMKRDLRGGLLGALAVLGVVAGNVGAKAGTPTAIYTFQGGSDGQQPIGNLIADPVGNLYGVTELGGISNGGTVFQLSPPISPSTVWTKTVLYRFPGLTVGPVGFSPAGGLVQDSAGNLYGTTVAGGGEGGNLPQFKYCCGTVFKLSPPALGSQTWVLTTIYRFRRSTERAPQARMILDGSGNLYGTTANGGLHPDCCGVVFKLSPPSPASGPWKETILHIFTGGSDGSTPRSGLTLDGAGNVYGATTLGGLKAGCCGVAFKLSPPPSGTGAWTETVLHTFSGPDGINVKTDVVFDGSGNLYGAAYQGGGGGAICGNRGCGTIFQLTPPAGGLGSWTERTLYRFSVSATTGFPFTVLYQDGKLYGSAAGGSAGQGVGFVLSPTTKKYWTETETSFTGGAGAGPQALVTDRPVSGTGTFYGVAETDVPPGPGTVFSWTP